MGQILQSADCFLNLKMFAEFKPGSQGVQLCCLMFVATTSGLA